MPDMVKVIKNNLFEAPPIFKTIQEGSGADNKEMYQVFNMGCRLEIYTDEKSADAVISTSESFGIDAQVIGSLEEAIENELVLITPSGNRISYIM